MSKDSAVRLKAKFGGMFRFVSLLSVKVQLAQIDFDNNQTEVYMVKFYFYGCTNIEFLMASYLIRARRLFFRTVCRGLLVPDCMFKYFYPLKTG